MKRTSRQALSDVYEDTIGSQEEILERAKQEAVVQRRVAELRKQGLWSQRRLPKVINFWLLANLQKRIQIRLCYLVW